MKKCKYEETPKRGGTYVADTYSLFLQRSKEQSRESISRLKNQQPPNPSADLYICTSSEFRPGGERRQGALLNFFNIEGIEDARKKRLSQFL